MIVGDYNIHTWDLKKHSNIWNAKFSESTDYKDYISFPSENATFDHMLLGADWEFEGIENVDELSDHSAMAFIVKKVN